MPVWRIWLYRALIDLLALAALAVLAGLLGNFVLGIRLPFQGSAVTCAGPLKRSFDGSQLSQHGDPSFATKGGGALGNAGGDYGTFSAGNQPTAPVIAAASDWSALTALRAADGAAVMLWTAAVSDSAAPSSCPASDRPISLCGVNSALWAARAAGAIEGGTIALCCWGIDGMAALRSLFALGPAIAPWSTAQLYFNARGVQLCSSRAYTVWVDRGADGGLARAYLVLDILSGADTATSDRRGTEGGSSAVRGTSGAAHDAVGPRSAAAEGRAAGGNHTAAGTAPVIDDRSGAVPRAINLAVKAVYCCIIGLAVYVACTLSQRPSACGVRGLAEVELPCQRLNLSCFALVLCMPFSIIFMLL